MSFLTGRSLDWAITAAAGSGFLLFGYDQGVMSGLLTGNAFTKQFPSIDTTDGGKGSSSLQGTVVAIYEIGCFFGALLAFVFAEKLGRRWSIMTGCAILAVGAAVQCASYSVAQLIVGRIIAGLGNGINTATIPVWHSELMKPKSRGQGLSVELAINIFGVMLSYWTDYGMSFVNSQAQFRFPIAFQIFFALVTIALMLFLPESPRWLISHDRIPEARHILWRLQRSAKEITQDHAVIEAELIDIQKSLAEERSDAGGSVSVIAMFKSSPQRFRRRTLLGIGGQFIQQLCGINLITYYAPVIFQQSVGLSHNLSFACGIVAIVMLFLFNFFFAIGLLAIPWLLPAEYAPLAIRTKAAALAAASNWIFTFLVVEITPVSIHNIGWKTYVYFAVFNAAFIPLVYWFYPETKNLSLEQVNRLFTGDKVLLHWKESMGERQGSFAFEATSGNEQGMKRRLSSVTGPETKRMEVSAFHDEK